MFCAFRQYREKRQTEYRLPLFSLKLFSKCSFQRIVGQADKIIGAHAVKVAKLDQIVDLQLCASVLDMTVPLYKINATQWLSIWALTKGDRLIFIALLVWVKLLLCCGKIGKCLLKIGLLREERGMPGRDDMAEDPFVGRGGHIFHQIVDVVRS